MEQAGIEQQQPVFSLRLDLAAVNVDHIRQKLEGIERDADRQRDGRDDLRPAGQRLEVAEQEAGVFEDTEDDQHQRNADDHPELFLRFAVGRADAQRGEPADADHAEQQEQVARPCPRIEHEGEDEHDDVLAANVRHERLRDIVRREEQKHEQEAGKYHGAFSFLSPTGGGVHNRNYYSIFCRTAQAVCARDSTAADGFFLRPAVSGCFLSKFVKK